MVLSKGYRFLVTRIDVELVFRVSTRDQDMQGWNLAFEWYLATDRYVISHLNRPLSTFKKYMEVAIIDNTAHVEKSPCNLVAHFSQLVSDVIVLLICHKVIHCTVYNFFVGFLSSILLQNLLRDD